MMNRTLYPKRKPFSKKTDLSRPPISTVRKKGIPQPKDRKRAQEEKETPQTQKASIARSASIFQKPSLIRLIQTFLQYYRRRIPSYVFVVLPKCTVNPCRLSYSLLPCRRTLAGNWGYLDSVKRGRGGNTRCSIFVSIFVSRARVDPQYKHDDPEVVFSLSLSRGWNHAKFVYDAAVMRPLGTWPLALCSSSYGGRLTMPPVTGS